MNSPELEGTVQGFSAWLVFQGFRILPTKGEWEVLRWENPNYGDGPRIAYTNKHRKEITKFSDSEAETDWLAYSIPTTGKRIAMVPASDDGFGTTADKAGQLRLVSDAVIPPAPPTTLTIKPSEVGTYRGAEIYDEQGRWVGNLHATYGAKGKDLPNFDALCRLVESAPKLLQYLKDYEDLADGEFWPGHPTVVELQQFINYIEKGITHGPSTE